MSTLTHGLLLIVGLHSSIFAGLGSGLQCLDPNGNEIDWYFVYKTPMIHHQKDWKFRDGLAQFYLDVYSPKWVLSPKALNETDHAVYNTLQQIYSSKGNSILYMMYNDEPPEAATNRGGHTKGVVAFDKTSGYWLIHSTPKFPPVRSEGYSYKNEEFAQSFLCISFPYKQLQNVATQLLYNEPDVYDYIMPPAFVDDFPILQKVIDRKSPPGPPWYSVLNVTSLRGQNLTSFAKSRDFSADLYDALVAPTLRNSLLVETWLRTKGGELSSNCTPEFKVLKVTSVSLPQMIEFAESKDHAKWAVTYFKQEPSMYFNNEKFTDTVLPKELPWSCMGDINRMQSQFTRGGGTMCLQNQEVWKSFRDSIDSFEGC